MLGSLEKPHTKDTGTYFFRTLVHRELHQRNSQLDLESVTGDCKAKDGEEGALVLS
jgi:hypothetical protein